MKKQPIYFFLLLIFVLYACSNEIDSRINGQWQLNTIEENGVTSRVDTVFYCFQEGALFVYTVLIPKAYKEYFYYCGYANYPSENTVEISMPEDDGGPIDFQFITKSNWEERQKTFTVETIDSKRMVLSEGGKRYSFRKH
jgi:hypothetical protein